MGLIEDAKAAADAGLSCGQYKSKFTIVPVKHKSKKVCAKCGERLLPHQYKYCSAKCREAMQTQNRRGDWLV